MACRVILSPKTGEEITSSLWNKIYDYSGSEETADAIYKKLLTPEFLDSRGDWINDPFSDTINIELDENGEPMFEAISELLYKDDTSTPKRIEEFLYDPLARQLFNKFYVSSSERFYEKLSQFLDEKTVNDIKIREPKERYTSIYDIVNKLEQAAPVYQSPTEFYYKETLPIINLSEGSLDILNNKESGVMVKPSRYPSGIYKIGEDYIKVTQRAGKAYLKEVSDAKEITNKFIGTQEKEQSYVKDFFNNKTALYIYDVKDLTEEEFKNMKSSDVVGEVNQYSKAGRETYKTDDPLFDKYLSKFYEKRKSLINQATKTKDAIKQRELKKEISSIDKEIKNVATLKSVEFLIKTGFVQVNKLTDAADSLDNTTDNLPTILEAIRLTTAWKEIDKEIDLTTDYPNKEDKEFIRNVKVLRSKALDTYNRYNQKLLDTLKLEVSKRLGPEKANKAFDPIKDISVLEKNFLGIGYSTNNLEQLLDYIINENIFNVNKNFEEFSRELTEKTKDITNFDFLSENIGNNAKAFLTYYNRDFLKEAGKQYGQAKSGLITWEKYYDWFKENFDYKLTEQGEEAWEEYKEYIKDDYILYDEKGDVVINEKTGEIKYNLSAYNKELKKNSPYEFEKYLNGVNKKHNKGSIWFNIEPKTQHINSNYSNLSQEQKSFYEYYTQEFAHSQNDVPIDYRFGNFDIDRLLSDIISSPDKDQMERLRDNGKAITDFFKDLVTVSYNEPEFTRNNTSPITGELRDDIRYKGISSFQGDTFQPIDLLRKFKQFTLNYKVKADSEDLINSVGDILKTLEKVETTTDGRTKFNSFNDLIKSKSGSNVAERYEYNRDAYLYDKRKDPLTSVTSDPVIGERNFSITKLIDTVNSYTRVRQLALAPLSAISNVTVGMVNNFIYASRNEFFGDAELLRSLNIMKGSIGRFFSSAGGSFDTKYHNVNAEKTASLLERFGIMGDLTESEYFDSSVNSIVDKLFFMQKGGEFMVQGAVMNAMLLKEKVTLPDGTEKSLWDLINLDSNGELEYNENLTDKYLFDFFNKVKKVNQQIHGDYNSPMLVKKSLLGRVFMLFRTWLPQAVYQRFGSHRQGEEADYVLGETKGRWRSYSELANPKNLGKFLLKAALPGVTRGIQFDGVSEIDKKNLQMNVREMQFILILTAMTMLLKGMVQGDDDDDPQEVSYLKYLYNQTNRFQNELTFFYSPTSFSQFVRDVVPVENTLRQSLKTVDAMTTYIFDNEEDQYKNGFRKGNSKFATQLRMLFPATKQAESVYSSFNNLYKDQVR